MQKKAVKIAAALEGFPNPPSHPAVGAPDAVLSLSYTVANFLQF